MRGAALTRVLQLLSVLRHPRTLGDLSDLLEVDERTVRRDLAILKAAGVRVWRDETHGAYRLSRPEMRLCDLATPRNAEAAPVALPGYVGRASSSSSSEIA